MKQTAFRFALISLLLVFAVLLSSCEMFILTHETATNESATTPLEEENTTAPEEPTFDPSVTEGEVSGEPLPPVDTEEDPAEDSTQAPPTENDTEEVPPADDTEAPPPTQESESGDSGGEENDPAPDPEPPAEKEEETTDKPSDGKWTPFY